MDDRIRRVLDHTDGPVVLDLGAAQHDPENVDGADWLHAHLAERFDRVIGVDLDTAAVQAAQDAGYDVREADVEVLDLPIEADTVVAGELIEHVANPGCLLASVRDHLRPGGRFVLTTPNPWAVAVLRPRLFGRLAVNDEHVAWYGPTVLRQLLDRYGFEVIRLETTRRQQRGLQRLAQWVDSDLLGGTTWVAVAKLPDRQ